jgi:hypothetical protein
MVVEDVAFVPIAPKITLHFSVMYRPGFGGKVLAPFLASVQDYAAGSPPEGN